ncbi:MAG TPA: D-aminoacylase [Bryobacteraceae bacterium]|nr:D-aminoacylase [Bryobacteraceae bacterium]
MFRYSVRTSQTIAAFLVLSAATLAAQDFDLLLANARVVDGSGNPWYRADIGVRAGKIAQIGRLKGRSARRTIDVKDQVVSPGFIDMMGATSLPLLLEPTSAESQLRQGITTLLAGEGGSAAPQTNGTFPAEAKKRGFAWKTFGEYFAILEKAGIAMNAIHNVGAAQVRLVVIGDRDREPTPAELETMKGHVAQAMKDGAVGLSTALIYPPGTYAKTAELVAMAKVVGEYGGVYLSHMRNESNQVLEAIRETMEIGKQAGIPAHIFHLKAAGEENWLRIHDAIKLIQSARDAGQDVTADIYPYIRNGIGLRSFVHPKYFAQGAAPFLKTLKDPAVRAALRKEVEETSDWENWYRHVGRNWDNVLVVGVSGSLDKKYEGNSLAQIAKMRQTDEWTTFFDLLQAGSVSVSPKSMNEEQKHAALRQEWVSVCTDAGPVFFSEARFSHPRAFGSFPRILGKYVREEKVITLEGAVRRMSSLPANFLGLTNRGRIAPGMAADLVVFDPLTVRDTATFEKPLSYPEGMSYVIVNGQVAIDHGKLLTLKAGAVLRPSFR